MAQKVSVFLVDDLDGGTADETVSFAVDGISYEIDLSTKNAKKLRDGLAPYIGTARKLGRTTGKRAARAGAPTTSDKEQNQAIRDWAKKKGLTVSERGRIPASIAEQYHATV